MTGAAGKTSRGRFFEDYRLGEVLSHAVPRTLGEGERALYQALYPGRVALHSSDPFAMACGLAGAPLDPLLVFHVIFGKTVPDVSLNAVANLGYAGGRWHRQVYPGETLSARSTVIGLKQNSNGRSGVVWVRTEGRDAAGAVVLDYVRWVMLRKDDPDAPAPQTHVPDLPGALAAEQLILPDGLDFSRYDFARAGEPYRWSDYRIGEKIDHVDGVTVEEAEHMMATRLWQNTSRVHFDARMREDGRRLIYGGHVMSMARALSGNGLANAGLIVALNGGAHANPCFAGTTIRAWSEVLDMAEVAAPGVGALRLRLVAVSDGGADGPPFALRDGDGRYLPQVLLDMDYWALMPL